MRVFIVLLVLAASPCWSRSFPEDSVVSVYTTQPTTAGTHPPLDVYHQIANNIAERITSPIYRFLGIGKNKTETDKATKRAWENIEILDEPESATHPSYLPVDNDISVDRDVEELAPDAAKKITRKPEKITLYSSYLPVSKSDKLETFDDDKNDTSTEGSKDDDDDDGLTLDDVDGEEEGRQGFVYTVLEVLGSIFQLVWGSITEWFKPKQS